MRTLHADLTAAQILGTHTPYLTITFTKGRGGTSYTYTTADSPNKIKALRHIEEPYNSYAILVLDNYDRALPDLFGYYCTIGYGYNTASGNKSSNAAPLWVKKQFHTSKMGSLDNVVYMEGAWNVLSEMRDIASLLGGTTPPYYEVDYTAQSYTIYDIIKQILLAAGFSLIDLGTQDDSIIDTLQPDFVVNSAAEFEDAATDIYRLLNMTKTFCRAESENTQYFFGYSKADTPSNSATNYAALVCGSLWHTATSGFEQIFAVPGTLKNLRIDLASAPGSGKSFVFTVMKAAGDAALANTALTVTIADTSTSGTDTTNEVTVTAGDRVVLKCVPSGTPTSSIVQWSTDFAETVLQECAILAPVLAQENVTVYDALSAGVESSSSTEGQHQQVVAIAGTISDLYAYVNTAPGTDKTVVFTLRKNGADTTLTCTISGTDQTANDTTHSVAVVAGDLVCVKIVETDEGSSAQGAIGCKFVTTRNLKAILGGTARALENGEYLALSTGSIWDYWTATELHTQQRVPACTISDFRVNLSAAPGTSNSATLTVRKNGVDTALTVTISDAATTGSDTTHIVQFADGDLISVSCVLVGTFTSYATWGALAGKQATTNCAFRIVYPAGYSSYDYTYTSDQTNGDHQFKEFDWRDQPRLPNKVYVICNREADGTWDSDNIVTGTYTYAVADNNLYPEIVEYYVAATLTGQADADNRATAIGYRRHMENELGRLIVPHNCGQELYDWVKVRDKRGTDTYADYPPSRWGNLAIVGALTHVYDSVNGIYDLEITFNGIESAPPVDEVFRKTITEIEKEITEKSDKLAEDIGKTNKEIVKRLEAGEEIMYFPTEVPLTQYGQERLSKQMGALIEEYGMEGLKERMLKASEEFRQTERWKEEERRLASGEVWKQIEEGL